MMKPVYLTLLTLLPFLSPASSATTSLVLNNANSVVAGQSSSYNCTSDGNGADPTIQWSIRTTDGTVVRSNSQLSSEIVGGSGVSDGVIKSRVTFTVLSSFLTNHRLWCSAVDVGSTSPSMQIYTSISATTTTTASLGGSCSSSVTCSTANAGCVSSVCRCNTNYYDTNGVNNNGGSCSLQVGLGGTCTAGIDASCSTTNAVCSSTSPYRCVCSSGYTQSGTSCILDSATINGACTNPTRACPTNAACTGGICQCNNGYTYSSSLGYCIFSSVGINEACINPSRTCPTNAACTSGTCQCNNGYTYSSSLGYCVANAAGINGQCLNPTRTCPTNAACTSGTCQCNNGYTYSSSLGYCILNAATINEACTNPTRTCPTNAACTSGTCQCNNGYTYSSSLGYCITSAAGIGASCTNPFRTCPTNAVCSSGFCQCNTNYVYSSSLQYCISSTALVGESCINPSRSCITNAACSSGTCQCNSGYYQQSTSSCILPVAGQSCTTAVGCASNSGTTTTSSTCSNNVCVCPTGYAATSGVCYITASLGSTCNTAASNPCLDSNADCNGSPTTCSCRAAYSNVNGVCTTDSSSCPSSTLSQSTTTGTTSPSTPSVTVGRTCYEVDLQSTRVMHCRDSKATSSLQSAQWIKLPGNTPVVISTGRFINGDIANPNLTVSNAEAGDAGNYVCRLCYGSSFTLCTDGPPIELRVIGTAITSASATVTPTSPLRGSSVTFTCNTVPANVATSYKWLLGSTEVSTSATYTIATIGTSQAGTYKCEASNNYNTRTSSSLSVDVQYVPEPSGGTTVTFTGNLNTADMTITCNMNANPSVQFYSFYDSSNSLLTNSSSNTYTVTSSQGYGTYSCVAQNSRGTSSRQSLVVQEESDASVGAATENSGVGTGTIAAIVLGIIFLILLIIIIIVCCCSYGWCRKKEKVEPEVIVEKPVVKPYIPSVSTDFEEPRYTTPRYHLKPATYAGPIISMYDNGYEQPRPHQLPDLDTQYLYTDNQPKKHKKKKRRRREDVSPRRHHYEPEPEVRYAETQPASDEDLVVVPGRSNYFE